jgi:hypothetical protein
VQNPPEQTTAYEPKPRREGAWVLTGDLGWIYTANPERYDVVRLRFWQVPPQMQRPEKKPL